MSTCVQETREQCLRRLAHQADADLASASAQDILRWAADTFGDRFLITSSMGDSVLAHLASSVVPGVQVAFLDTGYHFPQTLQTRDRVFDELPVRGITVHPELTVLEQNEAFGARLYERDPDQCCEMRKVKPLNRVLTGYDAWGSGVRRDEAASRANTPVVAYNERRGIVKISPLATWTDDDVQAYAEANDVIVNPLVDAGFASIGCAPCTQRVQPGGDARSGRWAGSEKTECGLHL